MQVPKVWDLINQFKRRCRQVGWWVSEYEDIVNANGEYHVFFWVRKVHPKTFKSVIAKHCAPIREGISYRIVNVSYMAWIFQEPMPENLMFIIVEDSHTLRSTALYDLSGVYAGKPVCLRVNETQSIVFREFEKFLETEYGLNFVERLPPSPPEHTMLEKVDLNA